MRSPNVSVVDNGRVTIVSETLALDSPPQDRIPLGALLAVPGGRSGDESDGGAYSADYSIASPLPALFCANTGPPPFFTPPSPFPPHVKNRCAAGLGEW